MKNSKSYLCPRCDYSLVPVHAVESGKRRVVALTCPEPYCDHMQMVTKSEARFIATGQVGALTETRRVAGS